MKFKLLFLVLLVLFSSIMFAGRHEIKPISTVNGEITISTEDFASVQSVTKEKNDLKTGLIGTLIIFLGSIMSFLWKQFSKIKNGKKYAKITAVSFDILSEIADYFASETGEWDNSDTANLKAQYNELIALLSSPKINTMEVKAKTENLKEIADDHKFKRSQKLLT